jgi:hypothetical protein
MNTKDTLAHYLEVLEEAKLWAAKLESLKLDELKAELNDLDRMSADERVEMLKRAMLDMAGRDES